MTPSEIQRYLKFSDEFGRGKEVIQRNTVIVQAANTSLCGQLCIFVLKSLTNGEQFQTMINPMQHIHKVIGNIPFKPNNGFVSPKHRYTGPYNTLHLQMDSQDKPSPAKEPYNAVDTISMCHDMCYRDNDTPTGKRECNRRIKAELNVLIPKG